jgi:hypothetical protein
MTLPGICIFRHQRPPNRLDGNWQTKILFKIRLQFILISLYAIIIV